MKTVPIRMMCMNQFVYFNTMKNKLGAFYIGFRAIPVIFNTCRKFGWKTKFTANMQKSNDGGYILTIVPHFNHGV